MTDPSDAQPDVPSPNGNETGPVIDGEAASDVIPGAEALAVPSASDITTTMSCEETSAFQQRMPGETSWLRVVIVVWCFWLLGAWAAAWLSDTSVPRVRWMIFAGAIGLMLVWPTFRLSLPSPPNRSASTGLHVFVDWLAMVGVYQAVIWSLHLIAHWPLMRGVWLDAAVLAWSLLTALIVAVTLRWPSGLARWIGMALCLALVFAEPIAIWLVVINGGETWPMMISPIQSLWVFTLPPDRSAISPWDHHTLMVALVAVMGWLALGVWSVGEWVVRKRATKA